MQTSQENNFFFLGNQCLAKQTTKERYKSSIEMRVLLNYWNNYAQSESLREQRIILGSMNQRVDIKGSTHKGVLTGW